MEAMRSKTWQSGRRWGRWLLPAVLGLALLGAACTSDTTVTVQQPRDSGITVNGTGTVTVVPDIALISLGVEVTRDTVKEAREQAAEAMDDILDALRENDIEDRDIATRFFNISPQFSYNRDEGPPEIVGFTVSNQVTIKVREIDNAPQVLDDAVDAGGDVVRVSSFSFTVDEPEQFMSEARARALAMEDARARAQELADLGDVQLGRLRTVSESGGVPYAVRTDMAEGFGGIAVPSAAPTPLSPGEQEVRLSVFVVYDIE